MSKETRTTVGSRNGAALAAGLNPKAPTVAIARTVAEDKLWRALHDTPNTTTGELSAAAGIGKSTAGKALARWSDEGHIVRTSGIAEGGRRAPDRWSTTELPTDDPEYTGMESAHSLDSADVADESTVDSIDVAASVAAAQTTSDDTAAMTRLAPGGLRGLVDDFLHAHPDEEYGPSSIGKALARSSGAVNNALEKLVETGYAVKTAQAPKRFALAGTAQPLAGDGEST